MYNWGKQESSIWFPMLQLQFRIQQKFSNTWASLNNYLFLKKLWSKIWCRQVHHIIYSKKLRILFMNSCAQKFFFPTNHVNQRVLVKTRIRMFLWFGYGAIPKVLHWVQYLRYCTGCNYTTPIHIIFYRFHFLTLTF